MDKPLSGIKIIDFTRAMSGPFATMILGDLGAEVIKVESPEGDETRSWVPPMMNGQSAYFLSVNRNKKSIVVDLKKSEGRDIALRLIEGSDIVVENFRPGVAEKLGISYEDAKRVNQNVIYCSISGYGSTGPYMGLSGFDLSVMAFSGLMSITGEPNGGPVKFGVPIVDIVTGMFAAISIISALRFRDKTGEGQYIDTAMIDSAVGILTHQATYFFATGKDPVKLGSAHSSIAPYQAFRTKDGYIVITAGSQKIWENLCDAIEMPELKQDPRFMTNELRVKNRYELVPVIEQYLTRLSTSQAYSKLTKYGVPCSPVNTVSEALKSDQVNYRDMVVGVFSDIYGKVKLINSPLKMSRTPGQIFSAPPVLGQHTIDVLKEFGFRSEEISNLIDSKTIIAYQK
ncbi:L-carnitine dehydratase [Thermoplasma volcanium GSS1]|uniref:L-carnitine dehydratase n=1 Tax=Thermoplasma volcanium (strain ATCC 51530 / DSM 4299 / JCM 9571 / NBRC 15438 / GSS1) TaxID=273116 RepID=Q979H5_THEVO|nr:CaiB/BaiF CoA-transferase family protein [Thermoplasma volcanium]BAB60328.1 L-carnitine dehydratase [Thermoplasma volcanium GSS1]